MAQIINFRGKTHKEAKDLYNWAIENMKELGCKAEPIRIGFGKDDLAKDPENCMISVFYNPDSGLAILRRDWTDIQAVKFNTLVNYKEIRKKSPNSAQHMEENGKLIYEFYHADAAKKQRLKQTGRIPFFDYDQ